VGEDGYLIAPDGPLVADLRVNVTWAWIIVAMGAAIVAAGGLLL
jgi:hypothetical protein